MLPHRRARGLAWTRRALLLVALLLLPQVLDAQADLARADSLLRRGDVSAAEALLYRATLRRPRDPAARMALGRYLAARGANRVGAVLIEEARFFGAPPAVAALHLAPLYVRMDAWPSLAALDGAILTAGERERARWLANNLPAVTGPDSSPLTYLPTRAAPHEAASLGAIVVRLGRDSLVAQVDPEVRGLVLDRSRAGTPGVRVFTGGSSDERQHAGVLARAQLGSLALTNVPVSFADLGSATSARVGLDLLARFSPTFDPGAGRAMVRRQGRVAAQTPGVRVPLLLESRGSWIARGGRLQSLADGAVAGELLSAPWALDGRRGELVLSR